MNSSKTNQTLKSIDSKLNKEGRIHFQSLLTYDGNDYLHASNYTGVGNDTTGFYQNVMNTPQYITEFHFNYEHSINEPEIIETYHSVAFSSKIGKTNSSDVFEAPYIEIASNFINDFPISPCIQWLKIKKIPL